MNGSENKKSNEELTDEALDKVAGGLWVRRAVYVSWMP